MNRIIKKHKTTLLALILFISFNALAWLIVEFEKVDPDASITNIGDAWWYFIVTLTTVGYGDYFPVTFGGRVIGILIVFLSLGFLGFLLSTISKTIIDYMKKQEQGYFGTKFRNHFVVFGWDDFGSQVVDMILKNGQSVVIITDDMNSVNHLKKQYESKNVFVLYSNYRSYDNLEKANIGQAASVFINFKDDTKTLVHLINVQKQYPKLHYVVSLDNSSLRETFSNIGSTFIVSKNDIAAKLVASSIFEPDVAMFAEDLISYSDKSSESDIQEYKVCEKNPYLSKSYMDAFVDLKKRYNGVLIGLAKYEDGKMKIVKNPKQDFNIRLNDYLIVISDGEVRTKLEKDFHVKEGRSSHEFESVG